MKVKGLIIKADGAKPVVREFEDSLENLQGIVGGNIESLSFAYDGEMAHFYLNEEGKLQGMPENVLATMLADDVCVFGLMYGDYLAGDVVVLGGTTSGEEADVPEGIVRIAKLIHESH